MTVFRVRPWFLPTSLAVFLTEVWPDGPADTSSDADSGDPLEGGGDGPPPTRSADSGTTECLPRSGAADEDGERSRRHPDRP